MACFSACYGRNSHTKPSSGIITTQSLAVRSSKLPPQSHYCYLFLPTSPHCGWARHREIMAGSIKRTEGKRGGPYVEVITTNERRLLACWSSKRHIVGRPWRRLKQCDSKGRPARLLCCLNPIRSILSSNGRTIYTSLSAFGVHVQRYFDASLGERRPTGRSDDKRREVTVC